jgi:hypothetical protein
MMKVSDLNRLHFVSCTILVFSRDSFKNDEVRYSDQN